MAVEEPDARRIYETLLGHGVDFVVIGGQAVRAHGFTRFTADVDIAVANEDRNLVSLAEALKDLHAALRGVDAELLGIDTGDPEHLRRGANFTLETDAGRLDVWTDTKFLAGEPDYEELRNRACVGGAQPVAIVSLTDLIHLKLASGRGADIDDVAHLAAIDRYATTGDVGLGGATGAAAQAVRTVAGWLSPDDVKELERRRAMIDRFLESDERRVGGEEALRSELEKLASERNLLSTWRRADRRRTNEIDSRLSEVRDRLDRYPQGHEESTAHDAAQATASRAKLCERSQELAARIEEGTPPRFVTRVLGPVPAEGDERRRWDRGAVAILEYRALAGIDDPTSALGEEPTHPDLAVARRAAVQTVAQTLGRSCRLGCGSPPVIHGAP